MIASMKIFLYSTTFPLTVETFMRKYLRDCYKINLMDELTLKGTTTHSCRRARKSTV